MLGMNTQSKAENGVIQSSIALLQERFKQLQRVKEMRENRELVRLFSHHEYINFNVVSTSFPSTTNYDTTSSTVSGANNCSSYISNNPSTISTQKHKDYSDDELQVFIPPNYFSTNNNNRKSSCYMSSSSTPTSSPKNHGYVNVNEVSLSLWPPMSSYDNNNDVGADQCRRRNVEDPLSKMSMLRPTCVAKERPSCVSSAYQFEDSHVSDVDTTLHL